MIVSAVVILSSALMAQPRTVSLTNPMVSMPKKHRQIVFCPFSISASELDPSCPVKNSQALSRLTSCRGGFGETEVGADTRQDPINVSKDLQEVDILRAGRRVESSGSPICFRAKEDIRSGAILSHSNLERAVCDGRATAVHVRYDPLHHITRSAANAATGAYFGALLLPNSIPRSEMTHVGFLLDIGMLTIERKVTLLQPSTDGRRVFVRDSEGHVFSMELKATAIAEAN